MAKIRQSNLDGSVITGNTTLNETANNSDLILVYDQSSGTLKQINRKDLLGFPTVSSVSPTSVVSGDGTGNYTFTVTGSGFTGATASFVSTSGSVLNADTTTIDSDTQITMVIAKSSLTNAGEPWSIRVTNNIGLSSTLADQINIDASPVFVTSAGSLGSFVEGTSISIEVEAYDPESAGDPTFEIQSGSLPSGITLSSQSGGKATFSGTLPTPGSETTTTFVLRASDDASNTSSRSFSITTRAPVTQSYTSSTTFSVPSGVSTMTALVVAGGGGGSPGHCSGGGGGGGLIYVPSWPVTPGGVLTVTVGDGGPQGANGQDSALGSPGDSGIGPAGVLTAKGGGSRTGPSADGGSGGGGSCGTYQPTTGGTATQPTQPGFSGAYGFGNPGGNGSPRGGGGGGAGAAGSPSHPTNHGGAAGAGKAYTIADGTTPVGYAGGGTGGGSNAPIGAACAPTWGGGVGGSGAGQPIGTPGTANRGGGGGGGGCGTSTPGQSGNGGKGIIIVSY